MLRSSAALLLPVVLGCSVRVYRPQTPVHSAAPQLEIEVEKIRVSEGGPFGSGALVVEILASARGRVRLSKAWLTHIPDAPCQSGIAAWGNEPRDHALELRAEPVSKSYEFPLAAVEKGDPNRRGLALDVWYEADGAASACQRIAIAPDVKWRDEPAWFFGVSGRADVPATPLLGMDAALGGTARVGTWLGALRLRADVGYARKVAGSDASSELGLFGASADTLVAEMSRLGVRLGAGYWALPLWSSAESDSPVLLHGPALSTAFAILPRKHPWSSFSARSDTWSVALEATAYR